MTKGTACGDRNREKTSMTEMANFSLGKHKIKIESKKLGTRENGFNRKYFFDITNGTGCKMINVVEWFMLRN